MHFNLSIFTAIYAFVEKQNLFFMKKLKLESLKVQSFVTGLNKEQIQTIKGGDNTANAVCATAVEACQMTIAEVCPKVCTCGTSGDKICTTCPIEITCPPCA